MENTAEKRSRALQERTICLTDEKSAGSIRITPEPKLEHRCTLTLVSVNVATEPPEERPVRYTDRRLMASPDEIAAANDVLRRMLAEFTVQPEPTRPETPEAAKARDTIITAILRAINFERLGHAENSVAVHKDGRMAKRYYDRMFCCLRWIILEDEQGEPTAQRVDELDDGWSIVHDKPWQVTVRVGEKLPI